jgi:NAD(P)-dependent dehydrogenase (short-subunit alcohol dehydrogenase family)
MKLPALSEPGLALVVGGHGGVGQALAAELRQRHPGATVVVLSRSTSDGPLLDLCDQASIAQAAQWLAQTHSDPLRALLVSTGFLHTQGRGPERSWTQLDASYLAQAFAVNAIGPALLVKHFMPMLARQGPVLAGFLSAKVGSIGDNALGGWYGYRASKAALNQIVHTAAIELRRHNRSGVCVAVHPGTVDTTLSQPFSKQNLRVRSPAVAAAEILDALAGLGPERSGQFVSYDGSVLPW